MNIPARKKGQTMVEYIIIVVLIAITLLALVGLFGKAIAKKFSGATSALDEDVGAEAQDEYSERENPENFIKVLDADGEF